MKKILFMVSLVYLVVMLPLTAGALSEPEEEKWVRATVQEKTEAIKGQGIKLQYFATIFTTIHSSAQRMVYLFYYLTETGQKMKVEEYNYNQEAS